MNRFNSANGFFAQRRFAALLILGLAGVGGCAVGVQWRGWTFEPVHLDARRDQKLTFVYFRSSFSVACTNFEENILKSPPVLEALRPTGAFYCTVLDAYPDRALAQDWGVDKIPGVVILDPESRIVSKLTGEITAEQLLAALHDAVQAYPAASQPHRTP